MLFIWDILCPGEMQNVYALVRSNHTEHFARMEFKLLCCLTAYRRIYDKYAYKSPLWKHCLT